MDEDRKYKQNGYMDSHREPHRPDRGKPSGPKPSIDITGPRLPRLLQNVTAARCFNCSTTLPSDVDWKGACPKCNATLHCCKQCAHFEPSTRFQCLKPVLARIVVKDQANQCELFKPRVTVMRDAAPSSAASAAAAQGGNGFHGNNHGTSHALKAPAPRNAHDARAAFDNLFKK